MPPVRLALPLPLLALCFAACASAPAPAPQPATVSLPPPTPIAAAPSPPKPAPTAATWPTEEEAAVPVSSRDPILGSREAPVTIVEFGDYQCPFTGRAVSTIHQLEEKYGADLRFVWRNDPLPFHPNARPAAEAGEAVLMLGGSQAFWKFFDKAFTNQSQLNPESYAAWAQLAGVDAVEFQRLAESHAGAAKVDADMAVAKRVGAQGTPAFFINGVYVNGAQPIDKFTSIIDAELQKAKERLAAGTAPDRLYTELAKENYRQPAEDSSSTQDEREDAKTVWKVPVGKSPVRGPTDALVTIIEFGDFQCPYTKRVQDTLTKVLAANAGKVRLVWKDEPLPFHPRARAAAEVAREARKERGDTAFWTVYDALFASQPKLEDADLEAIAAGAKLEVAAVRAAIAKKTHEDGITADSELADTFNAAGTPHFFINGRRLIGAQPIEKFQAVIDEEAVRATDLLAKGTPRAALYDALIKDGKTTAAPEPEVRLVAVPAGAAATGPAGAKVVIEEFADFQCPFCKRAEDTLHDLLRKHPRDVRLVWRDNPLPFHPHAELAAEAAREALAQKGQTAFWAMHDKLYAAQATQGGLERPALDGYAQELGLDMGAFAQALDSGKYKAEVDADAEAAKAASIQGTPTFTVGGYLLVGAQPLSKFETLVQRVLRDGPAKPPPTDKLGIVDTTVGTGAAVKDGDKVTVHYVGTLKDGTEFDSSRKRGSPFSFIVGQGRVIKGWDQGLVGMRVGGRRKLTIPPTLGYGASGAGGKIPPNATLVFDIELLSVP